MIGEVLETKTAGTLTLVAQLPSGIGNNSTIYETSQPQWLVKVWDAPAADGAAWLEAKKRYQTFAALRYWGRELQCLPREYVLVQGMPAYLMRRGEGRVLQAAWHDVEQLGLPERLRIARSLAVGICLLHSSHVVLSDFKRDNFFLDIATLTVQVLDVDGGGYDGRWPVRASFPPTAFANGRYIAPELSGTAQQNMTLIWQNPKRRREADLWSLAVLIYDLLVLDVPFSRRYFRPTDYLFDQAPWPAPRQRAELEALGLPREVLMTFGAVFRAKQRRNTAVFRPTAGHWIAALGMAISGRRPRYPTVSTRLRALVPLRTPIPAPLFPPLVS